MSKKRISLLFLFGVLLFGCGGSNDEPSEKNIITALKFKLPHYIQVNDLQIDVSENIGSKVEPIVKSRFKGKLQLIEDLYETEKVILNKTVLRKVSDKKSKHDLFGISRSTYKMDKWSVNFEKLEMLPQPSGKPLANYSKDTFVISGSMEENALIDQKKKKDNDEKKLVSKNIKLISGHWSGEYICGQGATGITLDVSSVSKTLAVTLKFFPIKSNPKVKKGSYTLSGVIKSNKSFKLTPKSWIDSSSGYSMVSLSGLIDDEGKKITGNLSSAGCSTFEMKKISNEELESLKQKAIKEKKQVETFARVSGERKIG